MKRVKLILTIVFYAVPFLAGLIYLGVTFAQWGFFNYTPSIPDFEEAAVVLIPTIFTIWALYDDATRPKYL